MTNAPKRWLEADSDVSDRARQLLTHGRPTPAMPAEVRAASAASIAKLGGSATAASGAGLKLLLGALALTAGVVALIAVSLPGSEPMRPVIDTESAVSPRVEEPPLQEDPVLEDEPQPPEPRAEAEPEQGASPRLEPTVAPIPATQVEDGAPREEVSPTDETQNEGDSLAAEVALIERARSQLGSDPAAALTTTQEHMREFPRGQLAAPAQLLAIDALLRLGRRGEANEHARALAARNPSSIYRDRLVSLVGEDALR